MGSRETGHRKTGDWEIGRQETGDRRQETGDRRHGVRRQEPRDGRQGDRETGYSDTGDREIGDRETGRV